MLAMKANARLPIHLPASLAAWGTAEFEAVIKREIEGLGPGCLPLQQGLSMSSYALDDRLEVMIISVADDPGAIQAHLGVFFSGIIAGCSCPGDPTPVEPQSEYCEMRLTIDKASAEATFAAL